MTNHFTKYQMKITRILLIIMLLGLFPAVSLCLKKTHVSIYLSSTMNNKKLSVFFDNGLNKRKIETISRDTLKIERDYYGRYATIAFFYPDSTEKEGDAGTFFWVDSIPAIIDFSQNYEKKTNPIRHSKTICAIPLASQGADAYDKYTDKERKEASNYYVTFKDSMNNPHYTAILGQKQQKAQYKGLDFIKMNADSYYALYTFKNDYALSDWLPANDLLTFFQTTFPDSLKQTFEGHEILKRLTGRINVKKGGEAPVFEGKERNGSVINLRDLRGKYVLLDFWASWCGPCRRLNPIVRKIREQFSSENLAILSLSTDTNIKDCQKAIEEDKPTWTQIMPDINIQNSYAITAIPAILLLNPQGVVIYNRMEDEDPDLNKLEQLLSSLIKK